MTEIRLGERLAKRIDNYEQRDRTAICYWKVDNGWLLYLPTTDEMGILGNLCAHQVTEHEDGTINVSPSILVTAPSVGVVHGFLTRNVWRDA